MNGAGPENGERRPSVPRRLWAGGTAALSLGLLAGCAPRLPARHAWPPAPAILEVGMREYGFDHPAVLPAGRAVVRLHNTGTVGHQLVLVRLPDDLEGTLNDQLHSDVRRPTSITTLLPGVPAGSRTAFAVDLSPGRYGLVCFIEDADGRTHALKGMNSELRVEAPGASEPGPRPDGAGGSAESVRP